VFAGGRFAFVFRGCFHVLPGKCPDEELCSPLPTFGRLAVGKLLLQKVSDSLGRVALAAKLSFLLTSHFYGVLIRHSGGVDARLGRLIRQMYHNEFSLGVGMPHKHARLLGAVNIHNPAIIINTSKTKFVLASSLTIALLNTLAASLRPRHQMLFQFFVAELWIALQKHSGFYRVFYITGFLSFHNSSLIDTFQFQRLSVFFPTSRRLIADWDSMKGALCTR
jgi:hypothetical protein